MTKSDAAILAKKIRCELRRQFYHHLPSQLFRVHIKRYQACGGGSTIYIEWHGAPSEELVRAIVDPYEKVSGTNRLSIHYIHREIHTSNLIHDMKKMGG